MYACSLILEWLKFIIIIMKSRCIYFNRAGLLPEVAERRQAAMAPHFKSTHFCRHFCLRISPKTRHLEVEKSTILHHCDRTRFSDSMALEARTAPT